MFDSRGMNITLRQTVKRCIILSVLLPSVSVFAQAPETPVNESMRTDHANLFSATPRMVPAYNSFARNRTTFPKASTVDLTNTRKVTKDDFGRLLHTVSQPRNTRMIWLGQQSRTHKPPTPRTTWLGGRGPSD